MKKALIETQTLRVKNFRPATDSLPGGAGPPKFNQLEAVTYLHLQTQFDEDRCTQFRVIVVTDTDRPLQTHTHTHTRTQTQTGPITIHCVAMLSTQCNKAPQDGV